MAPQPDITPGLSRDEALRAIADALGPSGVITDQNAQAPYLTEWRGIYQGATPLIALPKTTAEAAETVRLCAAARLPMTPQGGNTGLVGGQTPSGPEVLISTRRMREIRDVDPASNTLIAEAGCVLAEVQATADASDRLFPLSLASEGSAQIGGLVSTNAGGVGVLRYGTMRDLVVGVEAVLPDGRIWDGLQRLRKNNTGYDLKQLFIGAEGTLGLITAVALRLFPKPQHTATAFVALATPADATRLLNDVQAATGGLATAFELIPRIGLEFVLAHAADTRDPFETIYPQYALIEISSGSAAVRPLLESLLEKALETGQALDAVIAENVSQARSLWRLRESLSEAQKPEGVSLKHDVSVPVAAIAEFIEAAGALVQRIAPGCRPVPFGHVGDGNVHYNISQPTGCSGPAFRAQGLKITRAVHDLAARFGGAISAEHGIGQMKADEILRYKSPVEMDMMRAVKQALDPHGLMNPGKLLAPTDRKDDTDD